MSIVDVHVGFDFNVESYFDVDVVDVMFMLTYKLLIESEHLMLGSVLCLAIYNQILTKESKGTYSSKTKYLSSTASSSQTFHRRPL